MLCSAASCESLNLNGGRVGVTTLELMIAEMVGRNHSGVSKIFANLR